MPACTALGTKSRMTVARIGAGEDDGWPEPPHPPAKESAKTASSSPVPRRTMRRVCPIRWARPRSPVHALHDVRERDRLGRRLLLWRVVALRGGRLGEDLVGH